MPDPMEVGFFDQAVNKRLDDLQDQVGILERSLRLLERQTRALERVADGVESHATSLAKIIELAEVRFPR